MKALILFAALVMAAPVHAVEIIPCPPGVKAGMSYHLARLKMIQADALPILDPLYYRESDVRYVFTRYGYMEHFSSSANGLSCSFHWIHNGKQMFIEAGPCEEAKTTKVKACYRE